MRFFMHGSHALELQCSRVDPSHMEALFPCVQARARMDDQPLITCP